MKQYKADVLVVDDIPANVKVLVGLLQKDGYKVRPTTNGKTALRAMQAQLPDIVLLDINMPDMDGYEVCRRIKADDYLKTIPVIFISALDEVIDKVRAFRVGGADYITKPFEYAEVQARVETHVTLKRQAQRIRRREMIDKQYVSEINETRDALTRLSDNDRTPLANLRRIGEELNQHSNLQTTDIQQVVSTIKQDTHKLIDMVDGLLDLTQVGSGAGISLTPTNISDLLSSHLKILTETYPDVNINFEGSSDNIWMQCDTDQFRQVIDELVLNAIKFCDEPALIDIALETNETSICLIVRDHGYGIPSSDRLFIFDKFYRVQRPEHQKQEGIGLGLSKVKSIVDLHDGSITVESELNEYTQFEMCFSRLVEG